MIEYATTYQTWNLSYYDEEREIPAFIPHPNCKTTLNQVEAIRMIYATGRFFNMK